MSPKSSVNLYPVKNEDLIPLVQEIWSDVGLAGSLSPNSRVVIKPNLCAAKPEFLSSNTSLPVMEAVCRVLREDSHDISFVESDGMRHTAEEAFAASGLYDLGRQLGVKVISLTKDVQVEMPNATLGSWLVPRTILESDLFITVPILKTHPRTVLTGALKNQWGCLPQNDRILLHRHLARLLVDINRICRPALCVMDAIVGMEGRGPNNGTLRRLDLLLASTDPVALDATAMRLVGLDPFESKVTVLASKEDLGHIDEELIEVHGGFEEYQTQFEPGRMDWAMRGLDLVSRSRLLTRHLILDDTFFQPMRAVVRLTRNVERMLKQRPLPVALSKEAHNEL